jgi:hypothetical protein
MITFADLAIDPTQVEAATSTYRFEDQMSAELDSIGQISMLTNYGSTRTFDFNGNPHDADTD